jgi:hypothetical protein
VLKNVRQHLLIQLLACCAIRRGRGRRYFDSLDRGVGLKLANHFLAASIGIQHLTEESPEGVLLGEKPTATHGPVPLWPEKRGGDKLLKNFADPLEKTFASVKPFFLQVSA